MSLAIRILAVVALGGLAACTVTPAPAPSVAVPVSVATVPQAEMGQLLTRQRAAQGQGPVVENARLSAAAQAHASDMVVRDYFSHTGADGSQFTQRAQAAGYGCAIAENIAFGQRSQADVVAGWMASSGHRRNILLAEAREFGIGRAGTMWVLMMGRGC